MANNPNDQPAYPTSVDPRLVKEGEVRDDGTIEDNDLMAKAAEDEDQIDYIRKVLGIVAT